MAKNVRIRKDKGMTKVRCNKEHGVWYYKKLTGGDLDAPVYELYTADQSFVAEFGSYGDMKYYIETGIIL